MCQTTIQLHDIETCKCVKRKTLVARPNINVLTQYATDMAMKLSSRPAGKFYAVILEKDPGESHDYPFGNVVNKFNL